MISVAFALALAAGSVGQMPGQGAQQESFPGASGKSIERDPEVEAIGRELRCPVCQGMPIGESPSETAQAMMKRVLELHTEGKTHQQILDYFVERYGEWVLLRPEARGFRLVVWLLPPVGLMLGLAAIFAYVRRNKGRPVEPAAPAAVATTEDPYLERVREGVEKGEL
jgi:cytochrome c-type biogenesis protein CcmH